MKTNRFLLAACVSLAMALTLSCSDDKNSGSGAVVSCKYMESGFPQPLAGQRQFETCWEVSASYKYYGFPHNGEDCRVMLPNGLCELNPEEHCRGEFSNGNCEPGWVIKCGNKRRIYIYGYEFKNITCSEYEDAMGEELE